MNKERTAIFIDGPNVFATAKTLGFDMDYKILRAYYAERYDLVRTYYYTAVREVKDNEHDPIRGLIDWLSYNGYEVVTKPTKEWANPLGGRPKVKGNMDIEMIADAFDLSSSIHNAIFFTGDGDFKAGIELLKRRGVRCTVVSTTQTNPPMCADELRRCADAFIDLKDLNDEMRTPNPSKKESRYG
jgi:uncharacterized LabA/DUF88 family protein